MYINIYIYLYEIYNTQEYMNLCWSQPIAPNVYMLSLTCSGEISHTGSSSHQSSHFVSPTWRLFDSYSAQIQQYLGPIYTYSLAWQGSYCVVCLNIRLSAEWSRFVWVMYTMTYSFAFILLPAHQHQIPHCIPAVPCQYHEEAHIHQASPCYWISQLHHLVTQTFTLCDDT